MKITKTVKREVELEETKDIICNLCGESCSLGSAYNDGNDPDPLDYSGLIEQTVTGGYNSTPGNGNGALDDMVRYSFSLCEFCLDWLFQQFTIPVAVDDPMNDYLTQEGETMDEALDKRGIVQLMEAPQPPPWKSAAERVAEDDWRQQKEKHFNESNRRARKRMAAQILGGI
jgi:hypothetical protein